MLAFIALRHRRVYWREEHCRSRFAARSIISILSTFVHLTSTLPSPHSYATPNTTNNTIVIVSRAAPLNSHERRHVIVYADSRHVISRQRHINASIGIASPNRTASYSHHCRTSLAVNTGLVIECCRFTPRRIYITDSHTLYRQSPCHTDTTSLINISEARRIRLKEYSSHCFIYHVIIHYHYISSMPLQKHSFLRRLNIRRIEDAATAIVSCRLFTEGHISHFIY
jgi:hypothetical protein